MTELARAAENAKKILKLFGPRGAHWCKNYVAVDADGLRTFYNAEDARKWCMVGACLKLRIKSSFLYEALRDYPESPMGCSVSSFNDLSKTTFADVKKFLQFIVNRKAKAKK